MRVLATNVEEIKWWYSIGRTEELWISEFVKFTHYIWHRYLWMKNERMNEWIWHFCYVEFFSLNAQSYDLSRTVASWGTNWYYLALLKKKAKLKSNHYFMRTTMITLGLHEIWMVWNFRIFTLSTTFLMRQSIYSHWKGYKYVQSRLKYIQLIQMGKKHITRWHFHRTLNSGEHSCKHKSLECSTLITFVPVEWLRIWKYRSMAGDPRAVFHR